MKRFLNQFPYLKDLNMDIIGSKDVHNGHQLKNLVRNLRTFNFNMELLLDDISSIRKILMTFHDPFWLEEKHWFVAYQDGYLFSTHHFLRKSIDILDPLDIYTTAPDNSYIFRHITDVVINTDRFESNCYFPNVKTLVVTCSVPLRNLTLILDLNRIKHLRLIHFEELIEFLPLEINVPQLDQLSIDENVTIKMINRIRKYRFKQIRRLQVYLAAEYQNYIMEELFQIFSSVHDFFCKSPIQSEQRMFRCIDGFKHLEHASFYVTVRCGDAMSDFDHSIDLMNKYTRIGRKTNIACRAYESLYIPPIYQISWWIGEQVDDFLKTKCSF